jgi:NAD+ kinase
VRMLADAMASEAEGITAGATRRIGLVLHPSRDISASLEEVRSWAQRREVAVGQIAFAGQTRLLFETTTAADCELIVSVGGDGTMLAAVRASLPGRQPVLGIACGSLGVLTRTAPGQVATALDRFEAGDWAPRELPGLELRREGAEPVLALNDLAVVRTGIGQIRVAAHVDGLLYSRIAGDGIIAATPLGSSAYSLAAGGPVLALDNGGFVLTPLPTHGGSVPPLVVGPAAHVTLDVGRAYGGARLEVDGQIDPLPPEHLEVSLRPAVARLVSFADEDLLLTVLRRRRIVVDSPRIVADDERRAGEA